jgi:hypothetical protein
MRRRTPRATSGQLMRMASRYVRESEREREREREL